VKKPHSFLGFWVILYMAKINSFPHCFHRGIFSCSLSRRKNISNAFLTIFNSFRLLRLQAVFFQASKPKQIFPSQDKFSSGTVLFIFHFATQAVMKVIGKMAVIIKQVFSRGKNNKEKKVQRDLKVLPGPPQKMWCAVGSVLCVGPPPLAGNHHLMGFNHFLTRSTLL